MRLRKTTIVGLAIAMAATGVVLATTQEPASALPAGFADNPVATGLNYPTSVRFAADGRMFVLERAGRVKVFQPNGGGWSNPTTVLDISNKVETQWDRGALGLELDPGFTTGRPYLYILYSYDAPPGGTAPTYNNNCAGNGNNGDCITSGRISKFTITNNVSTSETLLVADWCMQFGSHSIGDLRFGSEGALYASGGEGASFLNVDTGNFGNPCNDPPGGSMNGTNAEGGSLRAQDYQTAGDPQSLDGSVIRIDPDTGLGWPGNPLGGSGDVKRNMIVAQGLRNPFRINTRPGTNEMWVGDVGWGNWEEINKISDPDQMTNFGWPCYEGAGTTGDFQNRNLNLCNNLYNNGGVTAPAYAYQHSAQMGTGCFTNSSSISGLAFYQGGAYPTSYNGGVFFGDYGRGCLYFAPASGGQPNFGAQSLFIGNVSVVDIETGPNNDIFYVDINAGEVHRITYTAGNNAPTAAFTATPSSGGTPLLVNFNASASSDPDGDTLTYTWDLDGDGNYGDATGVTATRTYTANGSVPVRLKVTDPSGAYSVITHPVIAGVGVPIPVIDTPFIGTSANVGQRVTFTGRATDPQDGKLTGTSLSWSIVLEHCPGSGSECHAHPIGSYTGDGWYLDMPDHEYASYVDLTLTATNSAGVSASVTRRIDYNLVTVSLGSNIGGVSVAVNGISHPVPSSFPVLAGSTLSVGAPATVWNGSTPYDLLSWSDAGAASHNVVANGNLSLNVGYTQRGAPYGQSLLVGRAIDNSLWFRDRDRNTGQLTTWRPVTGSTTANPALDGTKLYVRGLDGGLWTRTYDVWGDSWSGWQNLGGQVLGDPAAGGGRAAIRGIDGSPWVRTGSAWVGLGGSTSDRPAIDANGVYVRGLDGALWWRRQEGNGSYRGWVSLGGCIIGSPAVASNKILVRGCDNQMWSASGTGSGSTLEFTGWTPWGGTLGGNGVAASGSMAAVWSPNLQLGSTNVSGGVAAWNPLGGIATSDPAISAGRADAGNPATAFVFGPVMRGADGAVWYFDSTTNNWLSLGGYIIGRPAVGSP